MLSLIRLSMKRPVFNHDLRLDLEDLNSRKRLCQRGIRLAQLKHSRHSASLREDWNTGNIALYRKINAGIKRP